MKILMAAILLACITVTVVYTDAERYERKKAFHDGLRAHAAKYRLRQEADYWKRMAQDMVREVECIPLVGGKENRKYNQHDDPTSVVNDPGRYWYS